MSDIPLSFLPLIAAVLIFGGLAKGTMGFGLIVTTVPFLSMMMPPKDAMAWMAIPILLLNLYALFLTRREWREVRRVGLFLLMGVLFVPVGVRLLIWMPPDLTRAGIGLFIFVVVGMRLSGWQPRQREGGSGRLLAALWGSAAGFLHGSLMMPAPPIVLYLNFTGVPRDAFVFLISTIATLFLLLQVITFASLDAYASGAGWQSLLMLAPAVAGMLIGNRFRRRLTQAAFERLVLGMLGLVGISLLAKNLVRWF